MVSLQPVTLIDHCQIPEATEVLALNNDVIIFQYRDNLIKSIKSKHWCWLVLGGLQPLCPVVTGGVSKKR